MVAGLVLVLALLFATTAPASAATHKGNCGPAVSTTAKAHYRAQRGWDSKDIKTRPGAIAQVRLQARCVPEGKPERFVRLQIHQAHHQYKKAVKAESEFPTPESLDVSTSTLDAIRACESPTGVDDDSGTYHGYFQFDLDTWASAGGSGDPHLASRDEQYYRAALLMSQSGSSPWPVCG